MSVTECPGGPLLVRGAVRLVGEDGQPVPVRRRTIALCRCGASQLLPMCDGTHRALRPRPEVEDKDDE
ncbi:CDGSH iron-sulfur domain-containing protein [Kineosporia sp. J2-2]|uniref:CDGSH iron-sulfur domain-containing protein n=1 Tax=Kineosporia corallincola TaxID=2835133 RepID=A0ABS5TQ14_9ACTN|nr:CDGSH iron-sulfur domain-containing protein [Kineosporia corallincola]